LILVYSGHDILLTAQMYLIIIRNPSAKDTETVKIDFDVSVEGKHLTKGTIPAYELPAKQNTTILIKDVVIKYEERKSKYFDDH